MNQTNAAGNVFIRRTSDRAPLVFAYLLAVTLPIQLPGSYSISIGFLLGFFLLPSTIPVVAEMRYGRVLGRSAALVAFTAPFLILLAISLDPSRSFSQKTAITSLILFVSLLLQIVSAAWASSVLGVVRVSILYGAGALFNGMVNSQTWSTNPWKYEFAASVPILVIAVLSKFPRSLQPFGIMLLALYALTHESRNSAGVLLLTFLATTIVYIFYRKVGKRKGYILVAVLGGGAMAIASLVTQLALNGNLGEELQRVQVSQTHSATPIPGRVEYGATFALMSHDPFGLGPGVLPSGEDIWVGKSGLAAIDAATSGEYVDGQMFANAFEVHSVAGDLWVKFGLAGLFFAGVILAALFRSVILILRSAPSEMTALCAFLGIQAIWDLLFSPLYAAFRGVGFATGVAVFLMSLTLGGRTLRYNGSSAKWQKAGNSCLDDF